MTDAERFPWTEPEDAPTTPAMSANELIKRLRQFEALDGCDQHEIGTLREAADEIERLSAYAEVVTDALKTAEAALSDIGDADREPGDDLAWCEARAAQDLPTVRAALAGLIPAPPSTMPQPLTDEQIKAIAHRSAWRYKHSTDHHHSYTFNQHCLVEFVRTIEQLHGIGDKL